MAATHESAAPAGATRDDRLRSLKAALWAAATSIVALSAGGFLTSLGMGEWYRDLAKPSWQPPAWVFSAAWTTIFTLKAIAIWLVARGGLHRPETKAAVTLYATQLLFNVGWSAIFFSLRSPGWALVEIVVLDALVLTTLFSFYRVSKAAAGLLLPYALWLGLATALNGWIVASMS